MAFIITNSTVLSFAEYQDVVDMDQRLFDENEGLSDEVIEDILIRSTERILSLLKNTVWYRTLALSMGANAQLIPNLDPNKIISRKNDFKDLCVYYALYEYIFPKIADFGTESNAEVMKIHFYKEKFTSLLDELQLNSDWYDYDNNGSISVQEFKPIPTNYQRIR
jgi:hypothetical protein